MNLGRSTRKSRLDRDISAGLLQHTRVQAASEMGDQIDRNSPFAGAPVVGVVKRLRYPTRSPREKQTILKPIYKDF